MKLRRTARRLAVAADGQRLPGGAKRRRVASGGLALLAACLVAAAAAGQSTPATSPQAAARPADDDRSAGALRSFTAALLARHGGDDRRVPLAEKAAFFEWQAFHYHLTPQGQVYNRAVLPAAAGAAARPMPGPDNSTWNGALLAALSFKYAVTRDQQTLERIVRLIDGLHLFGNVTGQPGFLVRNCLAAGQHRNPDMAPYSAADGTIYYCRAEPAKGTYNQVVAGYAALLLDVGDDLPEASQRRARDDLAALVLHLVEHDYRLTDPAGRPTAFGDLTPLVGSVGVPFNAQVAYLIVAAGYYFPAAGSDRHTSIEAAYRHLREKHHAYFEAPLRSPTQPQRVAASPFLKGMNDRNHVMTAAFTGLLLDWELSRRQRLKVDPQFAYQLGRTLFHGIETLENCPHCPAHAMWAALLSDPELRAALVPRRGDEAWSRDQAQLALSLEQLRRFRLDRFVRPGRDRTTDRYQWNDRAAPDDFYWKTDPRNVWEPSGEATDEYVAAIDYLYAYWLLRRFGLEKLPAVAAAHGDVLGDALPDEPDVALEGPAPR